MLTFTYFLVEVVGGLLTKRLAQFADAAYMPTEVFGLGLVQFAAWMSTKPATLDHAPVYRDWVLQPALAAPGRAPPRPATQRPPGVGPGGSRPRPGPGTGIRTDAGWSRSGGCS